ncbi:MAG: polymer-forming cytoskeletal protein [Rhodocyclales bacterium]|nr:polymer-forming cytoskeletal protein [Rhodocyclales bacterium]
MFGKADKQHAKPIASLIGAGTVLSGHIVFSGGLRIDGEVRGNVRSADGQANTLVVGEQARIEGDIDVARLIVNGLIKGRVDATEFIKVQSKAQVDCDLAYAVAEIHSGAVIHGRLAQGPRADGSAAARQADTLPLRNP